jgi:VanZ like protein
VEDIFKHFGPSAALSIAVVVGTGLLALRTWFRCRRAGGPVLAPLARVLAVGSALLIIVTTAIPVDWPPHRDGLGRLILFPGREGLGFLDHSGDKPRDLPSLLLVANIAIYAPLAYFSTIVWGHVARVFAACLVLSVTIEAIQYLLLDRIAATDDVILNMLGAATGALLAVGTLKVVKSRSVSR